MNPEVAEPEKTPGETVYYFAYGSNLDVALMTRRCPSARVVTTADLPGFRLQFAGGSSGTGMGGHNWQGGVATLVAAMEARVQGVLYSLTVEDLASLDQLEGHPVHYRRRVFQVRTGTGDWVWAFSYLMPGSPERAAPSDSYFNLLYRLYEGHGFEMSALLQALEFARTDDVAQAPRLRPSTSVE